MVATTTADPNQYTRSNSTFLYNVMTTGKTIDLTTGTFVGKLISPFFNTLSRFGALVKSRAFSERSFQGKLPGGLERQWEW